MGKQIGYGIADFYNTITNRGLARSNMFRIKSIGNVFGVDDSDLLIYAQGGSIPSRQISSSVVSFKTFDYIVPMTANYPENGSWSVTFYCDSAYKLRDILETWSRATFDEHKNISIQKEVDVELVVLENSFSNARGGSSHSAPIEQKSYTLKNCFPANIGSTSYTVGNAGEFATIPVNIAFQYVISENSPNGN